MCRITPPSIFRCGSRRRTGKRQRYAGLVNAVLRRLAREGAERLAALDPAVLDTPPWLMARWSENYGEATARAIAGAHGHEPALDLTVKSDPETWAVRLDGRVLPTGSVRTVAHGAVTSLPGFAEGAWWVQDAAAALPARLFGNVDGLRVADLCAAPGGKAAQLAAAGARLTAVDRSPARLERLRGNLARLSLTAEFVCADVEEWTAEPFDAVLLDAPCSSTGTIRRHPDVPWLKQPSDVATLAALQRRLIARAAALTKPGGILVYCTCSLEPEEGSRRSTNSWRARPAGGACRSRLPSWPAAPSSSPGTAICARCRAISPIPISALRGSTVSTRRGSKSGDVPPICRCWPSADHSVIGDAAGRWDARAYRGASASMSRVSVADHAKLSWLVLRGGLRRFAGWLSGHPVLRLSLIPLRTERLLIAPQELRTADGTRASEIYSGRFAFAGKVVVCDGRSVFEMEPPSEEWATALLGFGWLRHLRAAESAITRANARALVDEWITLQGSWHPLAWRPDVLSRRVISWLSQSTLLLQDADVRFYRRFLRSLLRQVRYLRHTAGDASRGVARLQATVALTYAALCIASQSHRIKSATERLNHEIERQILPDGGHVGRNPEAVIELLLEFLPLRHAFKSRNIAPPQPLLNAIDRMIPMLRFFRHSEGSFAHFNGMGMTPVDVLMTLLAYDDTRGTPLSNAPHSAYQRLEAAGGVADHGYRPGAADRDEPGSPCRLPVV